MPRPQAIHQQVLLGFRPLLFNSLEGRAAPQNSFVSISVDSNPILSASFPSSFQSDSKNFKGH